ncbi:MAG: DivIVA domain-containing protein [Ignavibacteria bacterium]|nr:DivIVA domain-containing protein [Ignavibacteria bacterium]
MIISSKDIKKHDFKKSLRGYDTDEVDAFLETVSGHYERLMVDNKNQADRIKSLLQDIEIYKENESNLQKAIVRSQELGEEIVSAAKKRSELIIQEAELNSRKSKQDIEDEILSKRQELEEIKQRNEKTYDDLKNFLNDKLNELDEFFKNRKILKMELSHVKGLEVGSEHEEIIEEEHEEIKPMKKISLSPQSLNDDNQSFEDNFETK